MGSLISPQVLLPGRDRARPLRGTSLRGVIPTSTTSLVWWSKASSNIPIVAQHIALRLGRSFSLTGDEPHTGEAATTDGYIYRTLRLDPDALQQLTSDITGRNEMPYLAGTVVADCLLFAKLRQFHRAVATNADTMECEVILALGGSMSA